MAQMHAQGKLIPSPLLCLLFPWPRVRVGKSLLCTKDGGRLLYLETGPRWCTRPRNAGHLFTVKDIYFPGATNSATSTPTLKVEVVLATKSPPKFRGKPEIPTRPLQTGFVWRAQINSNLFRRDRLRPERFRSRGGGKAHELSEL